jgi:hypothetical protein
VLIVLGMCAGLLKEMRAESPVAVAQPRPEAPAPSPAVAPGEAPAGS